MKLSKSLVGKEIRVTWRDPAGKRCNWHEARVGKAALAKWVERGKVHDVSEGVLTFVQSEAWSAGELEPDEGLFGWIPEELIDQVEILEVVPSKEGE